MYPQENTDWGDNQHEVFFLAAYGCALLSLFTVTKKALDRENKTVNYPDSDRDENRRSGPEISALIELFARSFLAFGTMSFVWFSAYLFFL